MNIVEAYLKFNNKLIIIISGLSGSGKSQIASNIERDFKLKKIDIEKYCSPENDTIVELSNGIKVKDWDHIDSYKWNEINDIVTKNESSGVVICGPYFPDNKLTFKTDFHIHIKISKQTLIEKRHEFIKNNPEKCHELIDFLDTPTETLIINTITYPHYLDYVKESTIHKYINSKDLTIDQIYDQTADFLFNKIQEYLTEYNKNLTTRSSNTSKPISQEISANIPNLSSDSSVSNNESDDSSIIEDPNEPIFLGTTHYDIDDSKFVAPLKENNLAGY